MSSLNFEPPPTYADPVLVDEKTKRGQFNPIWLKWFVDLTQVLSNLASGTGSGILHNTLAGLQGGQANEYYHVTAALYTFLNSLTNPVNISLGGTGSALGLFIPRVMGYGRKVGVNAAQASVAAFTVGGSDGSFEISANVNVTAATTANFTTTCTYTDEGGTSRTLTLGFAQLSGATFLTAITNLTGIGPYESPIYHIRAKSATPITIATTGTFTSVTYNVEGVIKQTE